MENWCCRRCQFCHVCGLQTGLLQCDRCQVRDDGDDDDNGKMHCGDRVLLSLLVLPRLWSAGRCQVRDDGDDDDNGRIHC